MSKSFYEEALADARQLKEVAENNAKRAVLEAVTPRIKELIERELLGESVTALVEEGDDENMLMDLVDDDAGAQAISAPDADGKVTLDLDALTTPSDAPGAAPIQTLGTPVADEETEYELTAESIEALLPLFGGKRGESQKKDQKAELGVYELGETVRKLSKVSKLVRRSTGYRSKIDESISKIENMYSHVHENVADLTKRSMLESRLESYYKDLKRLKESNMKKGVRRGVNEEAVMLKISGIPDEVNVEDLDVDLMGDDGEEMSGDDDDMLTGDDMGGDGEEVDMDMSVGGDDGEMVPSGDEEEDDDMEESVYGTVEMDEDTVVEIDESMLRREIARMKRVNENKSCKHDASVLDDFGDGMPEGDAYLEGDVTTESLDELDEMDDDDVKDTRSVHEKKNLRGGMLKSLKRGAARKSAVSESAELKAEVANLRKQLAETNLFNAKLVYANKLLQKEGITSKQKAVIIDQLDGTKSVREAKLVYESLCRTLLSGGNARQRTVNEGRRVVGSSSRASASGSVSSKALNESTDVVRWQQLAGIK